MIESNSPFPVILRNPYRNIKPENSLDYAQKPQRNCTFMNSASLQHSTCFLETRPPQRKQGYQHINALHFREIAQPSSQQSFFYCFVPGTALRKDYYFPFVCSVVECTYSVKASNVDITT